MNKCRQLLNSGVWFSVICFLLIGCISCRSVDSRPDRKGESFNFYVTMDICGTDIIDTEHYTLTRKATEVGDVTIPLPMTNSQIDSVRILMDSIDFYSLPLQNWGNGSTDPHDSYRFFVRNGEKEKMLRYENSDFQDETNLDLVIRYILRTLRARKEYRELPKFRGACL